MSLIEMSNYNVAVIGAGPAGIYTARKLALAGIHVVLFNRDIKPGGLAEYGIYYNKYKMKEALRKQFRQILDLPDVEYFGNITLGNSGDLRLEELKELGFQAIMVAIGAQGTKWLNLPGEQLTGVFHAKDLVYHFNQLPPYSTNEYKIFGKVALIGVGNVSIDIGHWLIQDLKVDEVIAVARRGPAEVKFTKKEMEYVIANLDLEALDVELERVRGRMEEMGQDVQAAKKMILAALPKAEQTLSNTRLRFDFLSSPTRIIGDEKGNVIGLEVEDTKLVLKDGDTKAVGMGTKRVLDVNTVIYCIGDRVDDDFGLSTQWNEYVKAPNPRFPIAGQSYEAYDLEANKPLDGIFFAGWSREASVGLVGTARKDGENGAEALITYLQTIKPGFTKEELTTRLVSRLSSVNKRFVSKEDVKKLEQIEREIAQERGLEEYKFSTNEEMLAVIDG